MTHMPPIATRSLATAALLAAAGCATEPLTAMVPMRDGVRLATDVYLPSDGGSFPVVLQRTPYNRSTEWAARNGETFAAEGLAYVIQDTRGRFDSEGEGAVFLSDGVGPLRDGYDTIEWIATQVWCDGNVGMIGESADGITGYLAAATGHPALKCVHAAYSSASLYHDLAFPGGVFRYGSAGSWIVEKSGPEALQPIYDQALHGPMWRAVDLPASAENVRAAVYNWGGWFDAASSGTIRAFTSITEKQPAEQRARQMLVMGPWSHGDTELTQGQLTFHTNADDVHKRDEMTAWLAWQLAGRDTDLADEPSVRYYLMGDVDDPSAPGNEWLAGEEWPPAGVSQEPLWLQPDGVLAATTPPAGSHGTSYRHDPDDPVPTVGGNNLPREGSKGPCDQREVEARPDVVVFETHILDEPVAIAGNVRAHLFVTSDAVDTDFMVRLCDVYPDGRSMLLLEGATRVRYHESVERETFIAPGDTVELDIDMGHTAQAFNAGHRIRIAISSSNWPRYLTAPNTSTGTGATSLRVIATNGILHDASHPSTLSLPILPLE